MNLTNGIYKAVTALVLLALLVAMPVGQLHAASIHCDDGSVTDHLNGQNKAAFEKIDFSKKQPSEKISDNCHHCTLHGYAAKLPSTVSYSLKQSIVQQVLTPGSDEVLLSDHITRLERPPRA